MRKDINRTVYKVCVCRMCFGMKSGNFASKSSESWNPFRPSFSAQLKAVFPLVGMPCLSPSRISSSCVTIYDPSVRLIGHPPRFCSFCCPYRSFLFSLRLFHQNLFLPLSFLVLWTHTGLMLRLVRLPSWPLFMRRIRSSYYYSSGRFFLIIRTYLQLTAARFFVLKLQSGWGARSRRLMSFMQTIRASCRKFLILKIVGETIFLISGAGSLIFRFISNLNS